MISETEYNLLLSFDYNTKGHTQWYYFKINSKHHAGTTLKFHILNLMKPDSLYNYGMKPCVFSEKHKAATKIGWHRDGDEISYKMNRIVRNKHSIPQSCDKSTFNKMAKYYYTLSFSYTLKYDNDCVYFAHSIPYNYTDDLIPFLNRIAADSELNNYLRVGTLCNSFAGNELKMITITENVKYYRDCNEELAWMAKSQAARRLIRLKLNKKNNNACIQNKRKSK